MKFAKYPYSIVFVVINNSSRRGVTVALHGIGGVGKSTVAAEHGYRHMGQHYYDGVFFVDCSKLDTLPPNFADIGNEFNLGSTDTM